MLGHIGLGNLGELCFFYLLIGQASEMEAQRLNTLDIGAVVRTKPITDQ